MSKEFYDQGKTIADVCHAPWVLVEADLVQDRTVTSWPSLHTDIENAGGHWVDEEVHIDGNLITSRRPEDLQAFSNAIIQQIRGLPGVEGDTQIATAPEASSPMETEPSPYEAEPVEP